MRRPLLIAFDFDHTIVDNNTDVVVRKLLPDEKLPESIKDLYRSDGWIAYMGKIFELLHLNKIDAGQIHAAIVGIPAVPGMDELLTELHSRGHEMIIISDSNSIFIDQWLRSRGLNHIFRSIFTNPAEIDANGMMKVQHYHNQDWCKYSTINLCKGQILDDYIEQRSKEGDGRPFDKVIYVGDGKNDLCPVLRLSKADLAFPRVDYTLMNILKNPDQHDVNDPVKAEVVPWTDGNDILRQLDEKIRMVS